jgi:hypothetical protein
MTYFPSDDDLKATAKIRRKSMGRESKSVFSNATAAMATGKSTGSSSGSSVPLFGGGGGAKANPFGQIVSPSCVYTARGKEVRAPALLVVPSTASNNASSGGSASNAATSLSSSSSYQGSGANANTDGAKGGEVCAYNPLDAFDAERIIVCVVVGHSSTKLKEFLNLLNYGTPQLLFDSVPPLFLSPNSYPFCPD